MNRKRFLKLAVFFFVTAALTLLLKNPGQAQRMRMSVEDRVKQLTEQLTLTKDQADSVKKIYEAADVQRRDLFQSSQGDRSAMREAMGKITAGVDTKIEALLTDDQKAKYDKIKKDRPALGMPRPPRQLEQPPTPPPPPPDTAKEKR